MTSQPPDTDPDPLPAVLFGDADERLPCPAPLPSVAPPPASYGPEPSHEKPTDPQTLPAKKRSSSQWKFDLDAAIAEGRERAGLPPERRGPFGEET